VDVMLTEKILRQINYISYANKQTYPRAMSSFVKLSRSPPSSWRYIHSGFVQGRFRKKKEQYFVVPKEALEVFRKAKGIEGVKDVSI
jgi:hypothetical protein